MKTKRIVGLQEDKTCIPWCDESIPFLIRYIYIETDEGEWVCKWHTADVSAFNRGMPNMHFYN
jgi:hypothetical protein